MRVFYVSSKQTPKQKSINNTINKVLENSGHRVDSVSINEEEIASSFNLEKNYQKIINSIKKSDFIIIEISNMSSGLFFLIALSLNEKKPVLALNNTNGKSNSTPRKGLTSYATKNKLFTYYEYNEKNLSNIISNYILEVKKIIDTKFILIISPQIDRYLEWSSVNRRMHKAQVVRRAVEQVLDDDKEYKKVLNKGKRSQK